MSTHFTIAMPPRLWEVLRRDRRLDGAVSNTLATFESWLLVSQLPLFPDFIDHGVQHLNDVLSMADQLIAQQSRELLSPADIACLVIAVLLHDMGMHFTPEGV